MCEVLITGGGERRWKRTFSRATSASGTSCFFTKNGGEEKERRFGWLVGGGGGFAWLCLVRASLAFKLEDVWWRVKKTFFRH